MIISWDSKTLSLDDAMRNAILRHLRYALSRFEPEITRVRVDGKAVNGPRYGTGDACRITARLSAGTIVAVSEEAADLLTAAARAADRLGRAVGRALDRSRQSGDL